MKAKYHKLIRTIACMLIKKSVPLQLNKPVISFCFDDVPDSAILNGARILNENGYKATFYISLGIRDNEDSGKTYFDHSRLKPLVENGNELACHTFHHIKMYESNNERILSDLERNEIKLKELIPGYKFENFSYPYGQQTFTSKFITKKRYKSSRGVKGGLHVKDVDLFNLYANAMGRYTLQEACALVDEAILKNAWLIFYTHDVEENAPKHGCSVEIFKGVVDYCKTKQIECLTIKGMVDKLLESA